MDDDEPEPLFPELPPAPEAGWWEVSASFPDGEAPRLPADCPRDVMAAGTAKLTILLVRAWTGSGALATAERLLGLATAEWKVRPADSAPVKVPVA